MLSHVLLSLPDKPSPARPQRFMSHPLPLSLRDRFVLPEPAHAVELRAFTHGLMPKTVPQMMQHFVEDWQRRGADAWNAVPNHWLPESGEPVGWWTLPEYLGDRFIAPLLGAPEGACILQPNVHHAVQCLFSSKELFVRKKEVVVTENAFPSVLHSARRWADLLSFDLCNNGLTGPSAVLEAITDDTALVLLSHVGFATGERLPDAFLRAVAQKAHACGALLAVDGYHATASCPIDVQALEADLYLGGLLKEACGSSGNAYVYVRPGLDLRPRLTGWLGDAEPFAFHAAPTPHPEVRRRFMGGTPAVASLYHAVEGLRVLLEVGIDAVRADSLEKTAYCIARAEAAGLTLRSPRAPERRGAMVILEVEAADRLCAHLKQQHIYTDSRRGRYLRMAPFVWNTPEELARTFDAIEQAVRDGAYLEIEAVPQTGPVT